jgi:sugar phosphate isomerase/epimerase
MTNEEAIQLVCLEPLAILDVPPVECVDLAAAAGFRWMSLWVQSPRADYEVTCKVEPGATARLVAERLRSHGIRVRNLEVFRVELSTEISAFAPALELGARLGASSATAILRDDSPQILDKFVALCQLAAQFDLRINTEFLSYFGVRSLSQALAVALSARQPNAGVLLDLLHLVRSGATMDQVARVDPGLIGHTQICDGPTVMRDEDLYRESATDRMLPGTGDFPVRDFVSCLPPVALGLEIPRSSKAFQGLYPGARVQHLMRATRQLFGQPTDGQSPAI